MGAAHGACSVTSSSFSSTGASARTPCRTRSPGRGERGGARGRFPSRRVRHDILRYVGERGWVFLSKDENVRRRPAERQALVEANVAAFILTAGRARGDVTAAAFVAALGKMQRICRAYARPVIATVSAAGRRRSAPRCQAREAHAVMRWGERAPIPGPRSPPTIVRSIAGSSPATLQPAHMT